MHFCHFECVHDLNCVVYCELPWLHLQLGLHEPFPQRTVNVLSPRRLFLHFAAALAQRDPIGRSGPGGLVIVTFRRTIGHFSTRGGVCVWQPGSGVLFSFHPGSAGVSLPSSGEKWVNINELCCFKKSAKSLLTNLIPLYSHRKPRSDTSASFQRFKDSCSPLCSCVAFLLPCLLPFFYTCASKINRIIVRVRAWLKRPTAVSLIYIYIFYQLLLWWQSCDCVCFPS